MNWNANMERLWLDTQARIGGDVMSEYSEAYERTFGDHERISYLTRAIFEAAAWCLVVRHRTLLRGANSDWVRRVAKGEFDLVLVGRWDGLPDQVKS